MGYSIPRVQYIRYIGSKFLVSLLCAILLDSAAALNPQNPNEIQLSTRGTITYPVNILRAETLYGLNETERWNVAEIAGNLDLYVSWYWQGDIADDLHDLDPAMKVVVYRNIREIYRIHAPEEWELALANNWPLRDEEGRMIHSHTYPENYLMDIGSPSYQDFVANWTKNALDIYGFDGVWADFGLVHRVSTWGLPAHPVNPRTGQLYTDAEWINHLITLINKIKGAIGSKWYIGNGIHNGQKWSWGRENYEKVLSQSGIDGFVSEGLFTASHWNLSLPSSWYTEDEWKKSLDFLVWIQSSFLTHSNKMHMSWSYSHTDQESTFMITSFLLGVDKFDQNYVTACLRMMTECVQELAKIDLGEPTGSYHIVEGTHVYARDFTKVKILVNPSPDPYVILLKEMYETLDGEMISEVTVYPHTGMVLINPSQPTE